MLLQEHGRVERARTPVAPSNLSCGIHGGQRLLDALLERLVSS